MRTPRNIIPLRISEFIDSEYTRRDVFGNVPVGVGVRYVTQETARAMLKDADHYSDPKAIDTTPTERRGYAALAAQIRKVIGQ